MSESTTMTIRLDAELKARLDQLAESTCRSKSYLAAEAIREFIELNEWQLGEITQAITEADREDYATTSDIKKLKAKWGVGGN